MATLTLKQIQERQTQPQGQSFSLQDIQQRGQPTAEPKQRGGFLGSLARGIVKPVATLAARPFQLGKALLGATTEEQAIDIPGLGRIEAPTTARDVGRDVVRGLETVALGVGGGLIGRGAKTAGQQALKQTAVQGRKALPTLGKVAKAVPEAVLGTKGQRVVKTGFQKPAIQRKVISGEINTGTISQKIGKLAKGEQQRSINKLETARKKIVGADEASTVVTKVNNALTKSLRDKPLLAGEQRIVDSLVEFLKTNVKTTGSISKTKVDDLVRRIDSAGFFKTGASASKFKNSNKVVNAVRSSLRDITKQGNPKFTKLLQQASQKDIPFFERLGKNIIGKDGNINIELLQTKINQLVKAIDDPNTRQESLKLLKELAKRIGAKADFIDELEVFSRSLPLTKDLPGFAQPLKTVQQLLERGGATTARGLGGLRQAGKLPKLPGSRP